MDQRILRELQTLKAKSAPSLMPAPSIFAAAPADDVVHSPHVVRWSVNFEPEDASNLMDDNHEGAGPDAPPSKSTACTRKRALAAMVLLLALLGVVVVWQTGLLDRTCACRLPTVSARMLPVCVLGGSATLC
jgi:hypothetical protein